MVVIDAVTLPKIYICVLRKIESLEQHKGE